MTERTPRRRSRKTYLSLTIATVVAIASFVLAVAEEIPEVRQQLQTLAAPALQVQPGMATVVSVADGDTITVKLPGSDTEENVRMLGVDTPEVKDPRKPVQCFGEQASKHTKARIPVGSGVRLEPDPDDTDRDKYNRLLRYVYLPDGSLYNAELIREGYAFAYVVFPITKLDEFRALEADARAANRGLWAGCSVDESEKIKQTNTAG